MSRNIIFPVGRYVGGSVNVPRGVTDNKGAPVLDEKGVQKTRISFGCAIPKQGETDWRTTSWGIEMVQEAQASAAKYAGLASFSWKVTDGDSTTPNEAGTVPSSNEGYPGHWVIWFSQSWMPKLVNATGDVEIPGESFLPGYYIQVLGSVAYNGGVPPGTTPGLYQNPQAVALKAEGQVIQLAASVDTSVFATAPATLPAGAKPLTAAAPEFAATTSAPPPPVVVQPNPAILAPPPAPPVRTMTALATGTYEQYQAAGWSDQQLIQNGFMVV